jgi:type IV pilus assembly protein PilM
MNLFGQNKINAFGLDISDTSIKVMQLRSANKQIVPVAFAETPLMDKVINNHLIVNEQRLADNINKALTLAGHISTKYAVCSIPEAKSFVRTLQLPKMSEEEVKNAVPFELEQDIPVPVDQVYLDWRVIRETNEKLEVFVTAVPKDYVDSLVDTLKLAGLTAVVMELESQATVRALIDHQHEDKSILIADLATKQTSFIIVNNNVIEYTSSVPVAGSAFTESIARVTGMDSAQAEKLKREVGIILEQRGGAVRAAILPILDNVIDEIKNVTKFFEEYSLNHKTIDSILLCGGSARLAGVAEYISARINLGSGKGPTSVLLGDPWVNVFSGHTNKESLPLSTKDALGFTTAIGLALRGLNYEID